MGMYFLFFPEGTKLIFEWGLRDFSSTLESKVFMDFILWCLGSYVMTPISVSLGVGAFYLLDPSIFTFSPAVFLMS